MNRIAAVCGIVAVLGVGGIVAAVAIPSDRTTPTEVGLGVSPTSGDTTGSDGTAGATRQTSSVVTVAATSPGACGSVGPPSSSTGAFDVTGHNTSCAVAFAVATASLNDSSGHANFSAEGFWCVAGKEVDRGLSYVPYHCVSGRRTVTFDRS